MKVAISTTARIIVDELPTDATEDYKFLVNNGYRLLEVENPYEEDGIGYRALTDEEMKPFLLEEANLEYGQEIDNVVSGTPIREQDTWLKQELEAIAWTADNTVATPFIDGMMSTREKYKNDKAGLVAKILSKAQSAFTLGAITGTRQNKEDNLE